MCKKYIKIEWVFPDDAVPRLVGLPDNEEVSIDKEFITSLEAKTNNRIQKAYIYVPTPMFLVLAIGYIIGNNSYPAPSLILALRPTFNPEEFASLGILKSFGIHSVNEVIYETVRTAWIGFWRESQNTLYFEEFGVDHEQDLISVLELLMNILSTAQLNLDSETFTIDQTQISAN